MGNKFLHIKEVQSVKPASEYFANNLTI